MADCCEDKTCEISALKGRQRTVLKQVLAINAVMFIVESGAGILANSTALLADSLDMLGDALVYSFSLYVISRGTKWRAISAFFKGAIMAGFGLFVITMTAYKMMGAVVPSAEAIGGIGLLALSANLLCLWLLWTHRGDDINMHSVWLCSRNDIIANAGVLLAASGVWFTSAAWPDIVIGMVIAGVFLRSAAHVINSAVRQLRRTSD